MGKSAISMVIFNSYVKLPEGSGITLPFGFLYLSIAVHVMSPFCYTCYAQSPKPVGECLHFLPQKRSQIPKQDLAA